MGMQGRLGWKRRRFSCVLEGLSRSLGGVFTLHLISLSLCGVVSCDVRVKSADVLRRWCGEDKMNTEPMVHPSTQSV